MQRTFQFPMLAAFDATDGNASCLVRDRSNTPMQALTLLNDPVFDECARALGRRLMEHSADGGQRLNAGFELCFGRPPTDTEAAVLRDLVETQQKLGASETAIWQGVARTLLNVEEFITRE